MHFVSHLPVILADNGDGTESFCDARDDENT